jgi:hypothetical protein
VRCLGYWGLGLGFWHLGLMCRTGESPGVLFRVLGLSVRIFCGIGESAASRAHCQVPVRFPTIPQPGEVVTDIARGLPQPLQWLYRAVFTRILLTPSQGMADTTVHLSVCLLVFVCRLATRLSIFSFHTVCPSCSLPVVSPSVVLLFSLLSSVYPFKYLSVCLSICPPIRLSVCLPVCLSVCLTDRLTVCHRTVDCALVGLPSRRMSRYSLSVFLSVAAHVPVQSALDIVEPPGGASLRRLYQMMASTIYSPFQLSCLLYQASGKSAQMEHGYMMPHVHLLLLCLHVELWDPYWPSNSIINESALRVNVEVFLVLRFRS